MQRMSLPSIVIVLLAGISSQAESQITARKLFPQITTAYTTPMAALS